MSVAPSLKLLAWLSPAFPTGGFAYSHGLEWAVQEGDVRDGATLRAWVEDVLRFGSGRSDAILLRAAMRGGPVIEVRAMGQPRAAAPPPPNPLPQGEGEPGLPFELADLARAIPASRERLAETLHQGTAFAAAARPWGDISENLPYPVAVGMLAGAHGIDHDTAAAALLQAFAASLISAAVRLVPLGQSTGLAVLAALEPAIVEVVAETAHATLDDLGGACFRSDIAAMRHESQYTRLFRS